MSLILPSLRLLWVLPSRQQRLWWRPLRVLLTIRALTRIFWLRLRITSVPIRDEALESGLSKSEESGREYQDAAVSGTGRYAFQPDFPAEGAACGGQVL